MTFIVIMLCVCVSVDIAGKKELESYEGFLKEYSEQLQNMELALDETLGEAWDFTLDPLALQVSK